MNEHAALLQALQAQFANYHGPVIILCAAFSFRDLLNKLRRRKP